MKRPGILLAVVALLSAGWFYLRVESGSPPDQATPLLSTPAALRQPSGSITPGTIDRPAPGVAALDAPPANATTPPPSTPAAVPALEPEIREALRDMLNTTSEGLEVEERNGVKSINLQGRFRTAPVATIDEHGEAHITDYSWIPRE